MKTTNTTKIQTSQTTGVTHIKIAHVKIVKPRPTGTEGSLQGPRDCFPLG